MRDLSLWNPQNDFDLAEPFRRMEQMMNALWRGWPSRLALDTTGPILRPAMDVIESDTSLTVRMDLPGVQPDDVHVEIENNTLTINGEVTQAREEKDQRYTYRERRYGKFQRSLNLPNTLDTDKVEASFENGVLNVVIPKLPQAHPKQISIKTAK